MDYKKWFENEKKEISIVDEYYNKILEDQTGKYMFISKRRVKWFLLAEVHLVDCTLTYEKLWELTTKKTLLKKLAVLSSNIKLDDLYECTHKKNHGKNLEKCLEQIKLEKMDDYCNGIREEFDLAFRNFTDTNYLDYDETKSGMTDIDGDAFVSYCYNGERQDSNKPNVLFRHKREWCSDYFVGHLVEKFVLKIMLYDKILLKPHGEVFKSHWDSSPMSSLDEDIEDYLDAQKANVKSVVGKEETKRLETIRKSLLECSKISLTIFDVYRMFYVF